MADERARRAHSIFMRAVEVEPAGRETFLAAACADDPSMRSRVARLLAAMDDSSDFLETPALGGRLGKGAPPCRGPLESVGDYTIVRVIGVGGMATVYEAIQREPRRRVALKVMRHGLAHTSALNRFKYETEILARIQHPHIVQIFEAGAWDDGHGVSTPYFAMEYVPEARTLTAHANERGLSLEDRLRMFIAVCDAVQHGHQHGVIHRDLKPGNILVSDEATELRSHEGTVVSAGSASVASWLRGSVANSAQPKVIDFGVARSVDPGQEWLTRQTSLGQLVGTLNYMSPEQCACDGDLDIRTDVYSLGVILYELTCGRLPHDLSRAPLPEAVRIVRDEPCPRPGTLNLRLKGDIEAIILTAMDKERDRRYATVAALASDVRRFLAHQPIQARPATAIHRVRKFARRHRVLVGAAGLVLVILVSASAWSTWAMLGWKAEARRAQKANKEALAIQAYLEEIVASADPATGQADVRLVDVLRDASAEVAGRFAEHPEVEADLQCMLARAFDNLGLPAEALVHARRSDALSRQLFAPDSPRALQAANSHAWLLSRARQLEQSEVICREVIARTTGRPELMDAFLTAQRALASVRMFERRYDEAERILESALETAQTSLGADHGETLLAVNDFAAVFSYRVRASRSADPERDLQKSADLYSAALPAFIRRFGEDGRHTLLAMINLADNYFRQRRFDDAEHYAQRVLDLAPRRFGQEHAFRIRCTQMIGEIRFDQRRFEEAAQWVVQGIQMLERRNGGKRDANYFSVLSDSLPMLDAAGELEVGEAYSRILYDAFNAMGSHGDTSSFRYRLHLGRFISRQGRHDEAEELLSPAAALGPDAAGEMRWRIDLCYGGQLTATGRAQEAEPCLLAAAAALPDGARWLVAVQLELARLYDAIGRPEEADRWAALASTPSLSITVNAE